VPSLSFLTPAAALVALLAAVPIAAFVRREHRAQCVRRTLGLAQARPDKAAVVALLAVPILLGLAASQPVLDRGETIETRSDAEVFFVLDTTRSMAAAAGPDSPTRFARARASALRLRTELADVPSGIASLTDRTLPHLFPTADPRPFRATLERSLGVERPPAGRSQIGRVTDLGALAGIAEHGFFSRAATKRLLVVLTDGETRPVTGRLASVLAGAGIRTVFVHTWRPDEGIYVASEREPQYRVDASSRGDLEVVAVGVQGTVAAEDEVGLAVQHARAFLGSGPVERRPQRDLLALMPYLTLAAAVPFALLLQRRNLP
jgi:hypothetical protein